MTTCNSHRKFSFFKVFVDSLKHRIRVTVALSNQGQIAAGILSLTSDGGQTFGHPPCIHPVPKQLFTGNKNFNFLFEQGIEKNYEFYPLNNEKGKIQNFL